MTKSIQRNLPVLLTTDEKVDYGLNLAELHQDYGSVEIKKKDAADRFKNELDELNARISYFSRVIRSGEEWRNVDCQWRYIFDTNTKELMRMDTGEIVETAAITAEERQLLLQIDQEQEAEIAADTEAAAGIVNSMQEPEQSPADPLEETGEFINSRAKRKRGGK